MAEAAVATAEPEVVEEKQVERRDKPKRQPRYNVILWNDEDHTYAYVILMLLELFGHETERGYQLAKQVDTNGRAIILTTTREHAELKRDQVHAYGKDTLVAGCKGSMKATLEAVE